MPDVITRYPLTGDTVTLSLPRDHEVVHVGMFNGMPNIWIRQATSPTSKHVNCTFTLERSGQTFDGAAIHHGTIVYGDWVRHVLQV